MYRLFGFTLLCATAIVCLGSSEFNNKTFVLEREFFRTSFMPNWLKYNVNIFGESELKVRIDCSSWLINQWDPDCLRIFKICRKTLNKWIKIMPPERKIRTIVTFETEEEYITRLRYGYQLGTIVVSFIDNPGQHALFDRFPFEEDTAAHALDNYVHINMKQFTQENFFKNIPNILLHEFGHCFGIFHVNVHYYPTAMSYNYVNRIHKPTALDKVLLKHSLLREGYSIFSVNLKLDKNETKSIIRTFDKKCEEEDCFFFKRGVINIKVLVRQQNYKV